MLKLRSVLMSADPAGELHALDKNGGLARLEPSLTQLRMDIPKGYHHKDNLTHSIQVLGNAVERETKPDLVLRTAALFHDIGKPATRKFHAPPEVTFDGHEVVGARMVKKLLKPHGYTGGEINQIYVLVLNHMRSHGFGEGDKWTDSAVRRLIADAGSPEMLDKLMVLFYSDITTGIPKKKQALINSVDKLSNAIQKVQAKDTRAALRPALNGHEVMEIFGLAPGKKLGEIMKYLNTDEGIALTREEALEYIKQAL